MEKNDPFQKIAETLWLTLGQHVAMFHQPTKEVTPEASVPTGRVVQTTLQDLRAQTCPDTPKSSLKTGLA